MLFEPGVSRAESGRWHNNPLTGLIPLRKHCGSPSLNPPMRTLPVRTPVLFGTLLFACLSQAAPSYTLVDLGPGSARSINTAGKVVGSGPILGWYFDGSIRTDLTFRQRTFNGPSGAVTDWPIPTAVGINDSDVIVGMALFPFGNPGIAFPYIYAGGTNGLVLSSEGTSEAINASGVVVGGRGGAAFIFNGTTIARFASPGAVPLAINSAGVVAGFDTDPVGSAARAARFIGGATQILDLTGVPNTSGLALWSEARGINSQGTIVGLIRTQRDRSLDPIQGFVHSNGSATDLGGLGGFQTIAHAINDNGVIVGTSDTAADVAHAFVRIGSEMTDLNAAISAGGDGWVLVSAYAINAGGAIVGEGIKGGVQRAFLLHPAAEVLPPSITRQPAGTNVFSGDPFSLSVLASGDGPFTYQWRHSGTNLPGATSEVLTIPKATAADAGPYQVIVSNRAGGTPSIEVSVAVKIRPELALKTYAGLTVTGVVGQTYRIDASIDPQGPWVPVGTLKLEVSPSFWLDFESPQNPLRVYRAVEVP